MKKIVLLTDYRGLYRQDIYRTRGIDLEKFESILKTAGYSVRQLSYNELLNSEDIQNISDNYIIYTSSENIEYKEYIKDIIYSLGKRNELIPGYDILMCHEDKLYQELFKKQIGIDSLACRMYATFTDLKRDSDKVQFPVVVKKCTGAGSIAVFKAENKKQLFKCAKKIFSKRDYYEYYIKAIYKKLIGKSDDQYFKDEKYFGRMVLQEYVPDLECDWKVLVFGKKYYALCRSVRKNDFRASGSGLFEFATPETAILEYAQSIFKKMKVPFLSLDLCIDKNKNVYLIEFQGIHFGPYTLINSPHYFIYEEEWQKIETQSDLAEEYANAVVGYLANKESI